MKSPQQYSDEIARQLYMGKVPDIWQSMAKAVIAMAIQAAQNEALEEAARITDSVGNMDAAQMIRSLKQ